MSWDTGRILNNLEYEIKENKQEIAMLEQKRYIYLINCHQMAPGFLIKYIVMALL